MNNTSVMPMVLMKPTMSASVIGAPDGLELPAERQIFEAKSETHRFHDVPVQLS